MRGLIRRIQNRGYATLARIADHLDSLTAGDESNAVARGARRREPDDRARLQGARVSDRLRREPREGRQRLPTAGRVSGDDVSVGPFVSDSDEDERFREREETKRLLYVALTRARDRLYVGTALKDGMFATGRGSLGEVLPDSFRALFVRAAQEPGPTVTWSSQSGQTYTFNRV